MAAGPVAETHFSGDATGALKGVPAAITHFATGSTEVGARLWHARSTDIRRADFIGSSAISAIDLAATTIIHAAAQSSRTDLGRARLADIGYAIEPRIAGAIVVAAGELAAAAVVDAAAIERAASLFGAGLTDIGDAK